MSRKPGVVTAFVKEVDASQGRVSVRYEDIDETLHSSWAYVASPLAGKNRGALFMPEAGDEVLLAFGDNDFDYPYVVGFLWSGSQPSPEKKANHRVIVTPGGHELRFEDESASAAAEGGRVIVKSKGGHSITLEDKFPGKLEIKSGQHSILLDDVPGAAKVSVQAGAGVVTVDLMTTPPGVVVTSGGNSVTMGVAGIGVTAAGPMTLNAPVVSVNSPFVSFSGFVQCQGLVTQAVISPLYTPGLGNLI